MKKTILTIIQILVTLGILVWILHDPGKRADMAKAFSHAAGRPGWVAAGIASYGVVELLAACRWYILLRVQGIKLPMWRVAALLMLGIFFNTFTPGATGGDLFKIFFLLKETPTKKQKAAGLLAVLMDRMIGLMALIIISSVIIALQYHWLSTVEVSRKLTWALLVILVSSLGAIVFSFLITGLKLANRLPAKMPMRDVLIDLSLAYNVYAKAWPASLTALGSSFGIHAASFFVFFCAARALNIHSGDGQLLPFTSLMTLMPIILTLSALPISVGGTGVREGLFAALLVPLCGVSEAEAYTLSLTGFMMISAWALVGGLIYVLYRPSEHARRKDVERTVLDLEHDIAEGEEPAPE